MREAMDILSARRYQLFVKFTSKPQGIILFALQIVLINSIAIA